MKKNPFPNGNSGMYLLLNLLNLNLGFKVGSVGH